MFNKAVTPDVEQKQKKMFEMLINIYTPGSEIKALEGAKSLNQWEYTEKDPYVVTSMLARRECTIKEDGKVLFEIYQDNDYKIATRGKYLKHLVLKKSLLMKVGSSLSYHERYDMKHVFIIDQEDANEICNAFITRDSKQDNGLVKQGEIEDSRRLVMKT